MGTKSPKVREVAAKAVQVFADRLENQAKLFGAEASDMMQVMHMAPAQDYLADRFNDLLDLEEWNSAHAAELAALSLLMASTLEENETMPIPEYGDDEEDASGEFETEGDD